MPRSGGGLPASGGGAHEDTRAARSANEVAWPSRSIWLSVPASDLRPAVYSICPGLVRSIGASTKRRPPACHFLRSPTTHRFASVLTNSCPCDTAIDARQYGAQGSPKVFDARISKFGPARKTVVTPVVSPVT